ncbi:hypothetical protein FHS18_003956 [Paenibacillus phyllosphaerae]|uniref:Uncharacterized protein n=1 Tax=Paenibacillus phyllosphaerae TaxID=274593 RepID=A0A7W5AZY8_9BACL|nr:CCDC174 family protein [Paenibacillus phyllosphaerae]MBB3111888.1 hypothetical protein [Paenibacillus phyllosphaerae]
MLNMMNHFTADTVVRTHGTGFIQLHTDRDLLGDSFCTDRNIPA